MPNAQRQTSNAQMVEHLAIYLFSMSRLRDCISMMWRCCCDYFSGSLIADTRSWSSNTTWKSLSALIGSSISGRTLETQAAKLWRPERRNKSRASSIHTTANFYDACFKKLSRTIQSSCTYLQIDEYKLKRAKETTSTRENSRPFIFTHF